MQYRRQATRGSRAAGMAEGADGRPQREKLAGPCANPKCEHPDESGGQWGLVPEELYAELLPSYMHDPMSKNVDRPQHCKLQGRRLLALGQEKAAQEEEWQAGQRRQALPLLVAPFPLLAVAYPRRR